MPEPRCDDCLAWIYGCSNFSRPEGDRMTGWCRVLNKVTRQKFSCQSFSSKSEQEREYLARVAQEAAELVQEIERTGVVPGWLKSKVPTFHLCPDWDFMAVWEGTSEYDCCLCQKDVLWMTKNEAE